MSVGWMRDPKRFGERLAITVHHPEAYEILRPMVRPKPGDWMKGGCCVLAKALQQYLGFGELWMVIINRGVGPRDGEIVHVVLKVDNSYFDAEGCHSKSGLIKAWKQWYSQSGISLRPFDAAAARREGLSCPNPQPIVRYLERRMSR